MMNNYRNSFSVQVREYIRAQVEEGYLAPGTKLPSEAEMVEIFGVQNEIVQNAVESLGKEGILKAVDKDFYVLGKKINRDMEVLEGFTQTMLEDHRKPSVKVVIKSRRKSGNKFAEIFGIDPNDEIYYIKRICYANEESISLEEIYIPQYLLPKLEGIDLSVFSLYEIYGMYNISLKEARQTLDLIRPNQADARSLGIDAEMPVMLFQSITTDKYDRVIEFNRNYVRGDKCNFSVHFSNNGN